jgi:capsular exopolysaccharide synthesis family protein
MFVVALTVLSGFGATFYTLGQTRIYAARAVILFDPATPQPLGDQVQGFVDMGSQYWNNKEYYRTQFWIITSRHIAETVVQELGLNRDPAFVQNVPTGQARPMRDASVEDTARRLQGVLSVDAVKDSRLAEVRLLDSDPRRAQRILSALVDTYVQNNLDEITQASDMAGDWLRNQIGTLKQGLEASEMALHNYKMDKNILSVSMDDQSNMLRNEMTQIDSALTTVRIRREEARARRSELAKVTPESPMDVPANELLNSPMLSSLRNVYLGQQREYDSLLARGKGTNHPDMKAVAVSLEDTRIAFMEEIKNMTGALDHDLSELDSQYTGIRKLFKEAEGQALDLNLLEIEYNRLMRAKQNDEKLYSLVTERSKESDLTKMLRINNVRVVERPSMPRLPVTPNVPMNIAGGLLAGLVLGLAAAIGKEQLDRSIKTPDSLEREVGVPFLGLLPSTGSAGTPYGSARRRSTSVTPEPEGPPELTVHHFPTSGAAEAARAMRTNILFMSPDKPFRTLLITSAGPAEGKTTIACCIGIAMAQAGRRVCLLDCDMRRPRLHRVFGFDRDVGITTALIDMRDVDQVAFPTEVPNLSVVTTGPLPPNPAEILHSEAFGKLLASLKERFDCVILDSPPVVPVTDAAVLSTLVDGTVLVVRAFHTTKDLARRARRALSDVGGRLVGTVLNAVDLDRHEYGYRYYYYYKREGYSSEAGASDGDKRSPSA